jgi:Cu+-exporting ATPase
MNNEKASEKKPVYICPMHPEVHQEKPGNCHKCGMTLVPKMSTTSNPG